MNAEIGPEGIPITPDDVIRLNYGEGEDEHLLIAGSHETIQIFKFLPFCHMRYFDPEDGELRAIFLPIDTLRELNEMGVPHCYRESITRTEYDCYLTHIGQVAITDVEIEEVELTDAEIDWYLGEWENNGESDLDR